MKLTAFPNGVMPFGLTISRVSAVHLSPLYLVDQNLVVARFTKEIQAERVLCLTATVCKRDLGVFESLMLVPKATTRVVDDICKAFDIERDGVFRTTTYRPK